MADPATSIATATKYAGLAKSAYTHRGLIKPTYWAVRARIFGHTRFRGGAELVHVYCCHALRDYYSQLVALVNDTEHSPADRVEQADSLGDDLFSDIVRHVADYVSAVSSSRVCGMVWGMSTPETLAACELIEDEMGRLNCTREQLSLAAGDETGSIFRDDATAPTWSEPCVAGIVAHSDPMRDGRDQLSRIWLTSTVTPMAFFNGKDKRHHYVCPHDLKKIDKIARKNNQVGSDLYRDPIPDRHKYYRSVLCLPIRFKGYENGPSLAGYLWLDAKSPAAFNRLIRWGQTREAYTPTSHLLHAACDTIATGMQLKAEACFRIGDQGNPGDMGN